MSKRKASHDSSFGGVKFLSDKPPKRLASRPRNVWAGLENDQAHQASQTAGLKSPSASAPDHGNDTAKTSSTTWCEGDSGRREPLAEKNGQAGGDKGSENTYQNNTIPPSQRMRQYLLDWAEKARQAMLSREAGPEYPLSCETCGCSLNGPQDTVYRCFDCYHPVMECRGCAVAYHRRNPFHRMEEWDRREGFWKRRSLGELNLVVNLGHPRGEPCPLNKGTRAMTLVHEHGVHEYRVRYCHCPQKETLRKTPEPLQLIKFVMRDHHLLCLQSQISTHHYYEYLRRSTDNVGANEVTDRYREFLTAAREFSFMRACKRFDIAPSDNLPTGSLAVLCPACPQPGVNMDPEWEKTPPEKQFKHALYHNTDGNFQSNQKLKPMDPDDRPLTKGAAFFGDEDAFATYQENRGREKKESTTCHKFGAMGYGAYGGRVSGIVGISCARHMFVLPNGTVDLNVGEAYSYVDFVQLTGMQRYMKLRLHIAGYDINCQYRINFATRMQSFRERFAELPTILCTTFPPTLYAIGKFHLAAHVPTCRYKFSYNYLPGAAMTDGEGSERIWSSANKMAARTKEMTSGHRHDSHNDTYNDLNVRRVHGMAAELVRKYKRAVSQHSLAQKHLAEVTKTIPTEDLPALKAEEKAWLADVVDMDKHARLHNPYELKIDRGLTTKELLAQIADKRKRDSSNVTGILDAVYEGVQLQELREDLLDAIEEDDGTEDTAKTLTSARKELLSRVGNWAVQFNMHIQPLLENAAQHIVSEVASSSNPSPLSAAFPLKVHREPSPELKARLARAEVGLPPLRAPKKKSDSKWEIWHDVQDILIPLPSSFDPLVVAHPDVKILVDWETRVREAQANDALNELRTHIVTSEVLKLKKFDVSGKGMTTRMGKKIRRKHDEIVAAADEYQRAWVALVALGMDENSPLFRKLCKRDITKFTMSSEHQTLGESSRLVSWIWEDFSFAEKEGDERYEEFFADVKRVHWFRTSALYKRWEEELELVQEEMHRTVRFFRHYRKFWEEIARGYDVVGARGSAAYARKQANRHLRLLQSCRKHFSTVSFPITNEAWESILTS